MLRTLLLFTLICTCGPAHAQNAKAKKQLIEGTSLHSFTLKLDVGYSYGIFNQEPETSSIPNNSELFDFFGTNNAPVLGLEVEYAPATAALSWGLRLQYAERGYLHLLDTPSNGQTVVEGPYSSVAVRYLDVMPRAAYRFNKNFSIAAAPYVSVGLEECCNPLRPDSERLINKTDYGLNLEGRINLGRFYGFTAYQRSFRTFDYSAISDINSSIGQTITVNRPSGISAIRLGAGFVIIR
jgi:hypothetical protein